jgi:hypothetical protein
MTLNYDMAATGGTGKVAVFVLWLFLLVVCGIFAIGIPYAAYRAIRTGEVMVSRRMLRRSRHPLLFWFVLVGILPLFWWKAIQGVLVLTGILR